MPFPALPSRTCLRSPPTLCVRYLGLPSPAHRARWLRPEYRAPGRVRLRQLSPRTPERRMPPSTTCPGLRKTAMRERPVVGTRGTQIRNQGGNRSRGLENRCLVQRHPRDRRSRRHQRGRRTKTRASLGRRSGPLPGLTRSSTRTRNPSPSNPALGRGNHRTERKRRAAIRNTPIRRRKARKRPNRTSIVSLWRLRSGEPPQGNSEPRQRPRHSSPHPAASPVIRLPLGGQFPRARAKAQQRRCREGRPQRSRLAQNSRLSVFHILQGIARY